MYVVIGANGYLGSYIMKNVIEKTSENIIATARTLNNVILHERISWYMCDVQKDNEVDELIDVIKAIKEPIKLVYLAAFHHPDKVQEKQAVAWDINVSSLSKFVNKIADIVKCAFYASTDSVYGESYNGYHFNELDELRPVNFYGHNKCAAEAIMIHRGFNVVRFPFLISPSLVYKPHFYDIIVSTLKMGNKVEMYADSYRSSLSFNNAGWILVELMERDNVPQVLNVCGDEDLSKYDVGIMIAKKENLRSELVIPVSVEKSEQENFKTKRANSTLMDNKKLKSFLGLRKIDIFKYPEYMKEENI